MTTKHLILDDRMHPIKHSGTKESDRNVREIWNIQKDCKRL